MSDKWFKAVGVILLMAWITLGIMIADTYRLMLAVTGGMIREYPLLDRLNGAVLLAWENMAFRLLSWMTLWLSAAYMLAWACLKNRGA